MPLTTIHSVLLFDGTSTHENATVTFDSDHGRIISVSSGPLERPAGATIINGKGYTLVPGLIDAHIHCDAISLPPGADNRDALRASLRSGITTVCDMHSDPAAVKKWREDIAEDIARARASGGTITLSDLKSALYAATIKEGYPKSLLLGENPSDELRSLVDRWPSVTVENAAEYVKANKAEGADYIKLFQENGCSFAMPTDSVPSATLALQSAVTAAGHAEGLLVVAHANSVAATKIVLNAGVDGLTHTFVDQAPPQSIVDLYKAKGAFVIPTLTVLASLTAEQQARRDKFAAIARQNDLVDELTGELKAKSVGWSDPGAKFEFAVQTVKKLKQEGIDILAGTDSMAGLPGTAIGPSLWMELEMYVELCGMSATEALHSATALPAKRLDFPDRGVIAAGKKADLVLVKGNVTERLQHLWEGEGIVGMWKEGLAAEWFHERLQKLRDVEQ